MEVLAGTHGLDEVREQQQSPMVRDVGHRVNKCADDFGDHTFYCGGCGFRAVPSQTTPLECDRMCGCRLQGNTVRVTLLLLLLLLLCTVL